MKQARYQAQVRLCAGKGPGHDPTDAADRLHGPGACLLVVVRLQPPGREIIDLAPPYGGRVEVDANVNVTRDVPASRVARSLLVGERSQIGALSDL